MEIERTGAHFLNLCLGSQCTRRSDVLSWKLVDYPQEPLNTVSEAMGKSIRLTLYSTQATRLVAPAYKTYRKWNVGDAQVYLSWQRLIKNAGPK